MMTDESIIYFGKHKGTKLANVPHYYLLWLNQQDWFRKEAKHKELREYVEANMDALAKEQADHERKQIMFRRNLSEYKYRHRKW